jgi:diguanylate cyclase (GGDEF)-like protein
MVVQWCGETATTTVSIGVASLVPSGHMEWTAMVRAADEALYAAKASGRNRTVLAAGSKLSLAA